MQERDYVHLISLGAGVQSSTMALMAAKGIITPMPTAAIFADTGAEPKKVYEWLDWLEKQLPFPVHRVKANGLSLMEVETRVRVSKKSGNVYRRSMIPMFVGGRGILPRKCTRDHKLVPIFRKAKELGNVPRYKREGIYVVSWIGISTDEYLRMKDSRESWAKNRWPLIEEKMSRTDCLKWMQDNGYPRPPRSACIFCPYHDDIEWRNLKDNAPEEFALAIEFEKQIQAANKKDVTTTGVPFLHSSRVPLSEVQFKGTSKRQPDAFNNECEGMCGN